MHAWALAYPNPDIRVCAHKAPSAPVIRTHFSYFRYNSWLYEVPASALKWLQPERLLALVKMFPILCGRSPAGPTTTHLYTANDSRQDTTRFSFADATITPFKVCKLDRSQT